MPTYDYQCRSCNAVIEVIHSMLEDGPSACEQCGGALRRVLYPTGIIFKGSGFYKTDSRSGTQAASGSTSGSTSGSSSGSAASSDGAGSASSSTSGDAPSSSGDGGTPKSDAAAT
ncbi:MAG: FmdB family transcriptional regulator [Chloroflexi bacterium]|nr:FmdB family transcriptional regulator [Chloroflexota bacterium]